jgi:hypothetical protein
MVFQHTSGLGSNMGTLRGVTAEQLDALAANFNEVYLNPNSDANAISRAFENVLTSLGLTSQLREVHINEFNSKTFRENFQNSIMNNQPPSATNAVLFEAFKVLGDVGVFFSNKVTAELDKNLKQKGDASIIKELELAKDNNYTLGQVCDSMKKLIIDSKPQKSQTDNSKQVWLIIGGALAVGGIAFYFMNRSSK